MPTGYTADICTKDVSFAEFALGCARAFGACITMRDDPANAKIPDAFEPSDYYLKRIPEIEREIAEVSSLSLEDAQDRAFQEHQKDKSRCIEMIVKAQEVRKRLEAMMRKVGQWEPPTEDHEEMKKFMLDQLQKTLEYDGDPSFYEKELASLSLQGGADWKARRLSLLLTKLEDARNLHKEEVKRTEQRNAWVSALRESLS